MSSSPPAVNQRASSSPSIGNEEEEASTLEGLMTARAYIRSQLRDRMGVRHVPELTFAIDRSEKMTGRMEELLDRTRKRDQKRITAEPLRPRPPN